MKVLDRKLELLAEHAEFHVNINSVVGSGVSHPQDALTIGRRALELGFSSTIGIIHDGSGQVQPLNDEERRVYHEMKNLEKRSFTRVNSFQDNIALGRPNQWRCRAGGRYLYICEDGLVHYCSQQRGYPGDSAGEIYDCRFAPRILYREGLRSALHGVVRAPGLGAGWMARAAMAGAGSGDEWTGADRVGQYPVPAQARLLPRKIPRFTHT